MADIQNIIDKIISSSKEEADKIVSAAQEKAKKIEEKLKNEAEKNYKTLKEKAKIEISGLKDKQKNAAILESRDKELMAKQMMIAKAFNLAYEDLKNLNDDDYIKYLEKYMDKDNNVELVVVESKLPIVSKTFPNKKVSKTRFVDSGFIEVLDGVEKNYTFKSQLDYIRDDLQLDVANILFD